MPVMVIEKVILATMFSQVKFLAIINRYLIHYLSLKTGIHKTLLLHSLKVYKFVHHAYDNGKKN